MSSLGTCVSLCALGMMERNSPDALHLTLLARLNVPRALRLLVARDSLENMLGRLVHVEAALEAMSFDEGSLHAVVQMGEVEARLEVPDDDVVVLFKVEVPLTLPVHVLKEFWADLLDDVPLVARGAAHARLLADEPELALRRLGQDIARLDVADQDHHRVGLHDDVLDEAARDGVVALEAGADEVAGFEDLVLAAVVAAGSGLVVYRVLVGHFHLEVRYKALGLEVIIRVLDIHCEGRGNIPAAAPVGASDHLPKQPNYQTGSTDMWQGC